MQVPANAVDPRQMQRQCHWARRSGDRRARPEGADLHETKEKSRLDCAERGPWRIAVSSLHHVFICRQGLCCNVAAVLTMYEARHWTSAGSGISPFALSYDGRLSATGGWAKTKPKRGIVNRTESPLTWLLLLLLLLVPTEKARKSSSKCRPVLCLRLGAWIR